MLRITDPSTGPPGGRFKVKNPKTGNEFAHPNPNMVYFLFRKDCQDNDLPILEPIQIESLLCEQHPEVCSERIGGLGDLVALVAQPIAGAIDAVAGTQIKRCGGCSKRQQALNEMVPFK